MTRMIATQTPEGRALVFGREAQVTCPKSKKECIVPNSDEIKGRTKEAVGDLTDNDRLKNEGKTDRAAGKVKGATEHAKDKVEDTVDNVKEKLHRD
jgi:uncharacterized protein YjbJ (UPF0337 family)